MKYFFVLGSNPALSLAEIVSVLQLKKENITALSKEAVVVDINGVETPQRGISTSVEEARVLIKRLGGTIKVGIVRETVPAAECTPELAASLLTAKAGASTGKFSFGFSFYGKTAVNKKTFGMEVKRLLKEQNVSPRWVISQERHLSSVVVEQNKLVSARGTELVFIPRTSGDEVIIGETLAVQPFKELSARDYGRPGRDDYSGMLPPKLAQIMLNVSGIKEGDILLDPFCGSGTVLTEAALMGVRNVIGTDMSAKAIFDTKKNVSWLQQHYDVERTMFNVFQCDVRNLSEKVAPHSVNVIVAEPYLGPSRMQRSRDAVEKVKRELEQLYGQALREFERVLKPGGVVVMVWPVFMAGGKNGLYMDERTILGTSRFHIHNVIGGIVDPAFGNVSTRGTFLYSRPGQHVAREIVVLRAKP